MFGVDCGSACTVTVEFGSDLMNIDTVGGGQIALAVLGIWAIGWAFRMAVRALSTW